MHFSTVLQSIVFSHFLGVLVTDLSIGVPPATEAPSCVFQVLRETICGVEGPRGAHRGADLKHQSHHKFQGIYQSYHNDRRSSEENIEE